jgi:hypothetical protein
VSGNLPTEAVPLVYQDISINKEKNEDEDEYEEDEYDEYDEFYEFDDYEKNEGIDIICLYNRIKSEESPEIYTRLIKRYVEKRNRSEKLELVKAINSLLVVHRTRYDGFVVGL